MLGQDYLLEFIVRAGIEKSHCAPLYLLSYCVRFAEYGWNENYGYFCPLIDLKVSFFLFKTIEVPCLQHSQNRMKISVLNPLCD
ncbi:hypothetical protein QE152_g36974 [Popillia japonica]|uniref:Uncharacterized protein n=1 Tax=Popillia japonica TaxID=7064 RepID=A0AAW1IBT8_POPJA